MPSPFPGMDPWLESPGIFPDLHSTFVAKLRDAINELLPAPFYAALSTRVWLEESERRVEPDVDVLEPANGFRSGEQQGAIATLEWNTTGLLELVSHLPDDEMNETFIEIYSAAGSERLITSIELLSPSNKTQGSTGRAMYQAKQQELVRAGVHLVEIDLLRSGTHSTLVPALLLKLKAPRHDYHVCIHQAQSWNSYFVAPIRMDEPLPRISIPLTSDLPPVIVHLQTVLDMSYRAGNYSRRVRYQSLPEPPLNPAQQEWAETILREKNLLPPAGLPSSGA